MITTFENITFDFTEVERTELLPFLEKKLPLNKGKQKITTNKKICAFFKRHGYKVNGARVRKMIQYLRVTGKVPLLIATGKGYYVATKTEEVYKHIQSLKEREASIAATREALQKQLENVNKSAQQRLYFRG